MSIVIRKLMIVCEWISFSGPDTKNFEWEEWGEWSDCAGDCGTSGVRSRHRVCIPPVSGGYECPAPVESETEECMTLPCASKRKYS